MFVQQMSSRLQMARATNSQLQQDQEEELSQQQEAMAVSKFDVITNRSYHAKYKDGHEQFKKIMHQSKFATFIANSARYRQHFELVLMSSPNAFLSNILQIQSATCGTMMLLLSWAG
jgi:hypothetical protein